MKKYAALIVMGVCLTGAAFFIVDAGKSSGNAVFQDSCNGLEEVFSESPETMKNECIGKAENDSVGKAGTGRKGKLKRGRGMNYGRAAF